MGGKTNGNAMIASNITLNLNRVCESHHAIGVPINKRIIVLTLASLKVTKRAEISISFSIMVNHIQI